jgi:RimJ/RimL family protein N-acetyltransferase
MRSGHGMPTSRYAPRRIVRALGHRVYSAKGPAVVLRRDLELPLEAPRPKIPITVRAAQDGDVAGALAAMSELSGYDRANRELFLEAGIGTCYLAVSEDGEICYMQWLIGPEHNDLLAAHTHLPILKRGEALLENAFTPTAFRGRGIMASAMAQIAERGADLGARWVLTVVSEDNVASLKGCARAGFEPYMLKLDRWLLLRHQVRYTTLPPGYAATPAPPATEASAGSAPPRPGA